MFPRKPFNITVIQVYAPTGNAEEAEVEQFYEDLQNLLELTPQRDVLFIIGDWNAKVGSQETPGIMWFNIAESQKIGVLISLGDLNDLSLHIYFLIPHLSKEHPT